jgi:hypothetical protein
MKTRILAVLICLSSTGCYDIMMVNVGSSTHTASSVGKQLAPEVQCAALAQAKVTSAMVNIDPMETCLQAVEEQKMLDKAKHK